MKQKLLFVFLLFSIFGSSVAYSGSMDAMIITRVADYTYTGGAITPSVMLKDGNITLKKDVDYTLEYKDNVNVGTATIIINGIGNYAGSGSKEFNITKARLVVMAEAQQSKIYGVPDPELKYKVASGSLLGNDAFKGVLEREAGEDVGNYAITQGTLTAGDNYDLSVIKNNFRIEKAPLKVKPNPNQSKTYGEPDPVFTYEIIEGSLVKNDKISGELGRLSGENIGIYGISLNTLSAGNNYNIQFIPVNFEIKKSDLIVRAKPNQSKTYGETDPVFEYEIVKGKLVEDDSFKGTLVRQPGENIGKYPILKGSLTAGENYNIEYEQDNFEILRKILE